MHENHSHRHNLHSDTMTTNLPLKSAKTPSSTNRKKKKRTKYLFIFKENLIFRSKKQKNLIQSVDHQWKLLFAAVVDMYMCMFLLLLALFLYIYNFVHARK